MLLLGFQSSFAGELNNMATKTLLEFNSLKFAPPLSRRCPFAHSIPCRPMKRTPSLAVKARRFSDFKQPLQNPQKDREIKVKVDVDYNNNYEADPGDCLIPFATACILPSVALLVPPLFFPIAVPLLLLFILDHILGTNTPQYLSRTKTSVLKLQVGFLGKGRSLQKDLNRIAKVADSSSFLLAETSVALLRRLNFCISCYSRVYLKLNEDGEKHFNRLSIEERGKIDETLLVNVNSQRAIGFNYGYIVITILVAAKGVHYLPVIKDSVDLKEALQKLCSIPTDKIYAVDVIWTPEKKNVTLTEEEVLEYHPLLRPF